MVEFVVVEHQNPMLGLTHGVYRKEESGRIAVCLCYNEAQAALVAAALAAHMPDRAHEPAPAPEPVHRAAASKPAAKAKKPAPKRQGRKRA